MEAKNYIKVDDKNYVKSKCWVLPTAKKSNIGFYRDNNHKCLYQLSYNNQIPQTPVSKGWEPQFIHITTNETILDGDYYIFECGNSGIVEKATESYKTLNKETCKKIIASTDTDLELGIPSRNSRIN
jgi:hypothetical protein